MLDETTDQIRPVPQSCNSQPQHMAEFSLIRATDISQVDILQVIPDPFGRVQIGSISRQLLQADLPSSASGQECLECLVTVDRRTIPDDQHFATELTQQVFQKAHYIYTLYTLERTRLHPHQQLALCCYPADHRQMIPRQWHTQHWRLTPQRVAAYYSRQQVEASFVYPDDNSAFSQRLFLSVGQRSEYQAPIAASSRWVARTIGLCGLKPSCRRMRPT